MGKGKKNRSQQQADGAATADTEVVPLVANNGTGDEPAGTPETRTPPSERRTTPRSGQRTPRDSSARRNDYGATTEVTPTPARDPGQSQAPPPTPATNFKQRNTSDDASPAQTSKTTAPTSMNHSTGVIVSRDGGDGAPSPHSGGEMDYSLRTQVRKMFMEKWQLKVLLVTVPIAIFGQGHVSSDVLFFMSFFGLIPLAGLLGDFTEDLALRSNDVIGALINVTFGNATELIISIMALRAGMLDVIKLSLIGSVLGNMLLVLGTAFIVGGMKFRDMTFNSDAVNTYSPLLMLSILSFVIPSAYWASTVKVNPSAENMAMGGGHGHSAHKQVSQHDSDTILAVSRQLAVVMCFAYACYLYFQLVTHKHLFDGKPGAADAAVVKPELGASDEEEEEDEEEVPQFTFTVGLVGLGVVSILISMLSDILVDTLSEAAEAWNLPQQFIGIILVPIVGNAAEHASAIFMAARNKLDISVGVALGSSIQIAMFVMPVLVVCGWIMGVPLNMDFHPFLTVTTAISVLVVENITSDGKTNWLEGVMLICAYVMVALMFWNGSVNLS